MANESKEPTVTERRARGHELAKLIKSPAVRAQLGDFQVWVGIKEALEAGEKPRTKAS